MGALTTGLDAAGLGKGSIQVTSHIGNKTTTITLKDVLHVPTAPFNLISLGRLAKEGCKWQGTTSNKEILRGNAIGHLYKLQITQPQIKEHALTAKNNTARSWDEWHRILGHISPQSVKTLKDKQMVTGMEVDTNSTPSAQCTTCIQAKQHVHPIPKESDTEYTELGELTYSDVWGPARVTGINGERYFISFTDAAKKITTIAHMKHKSEADTNIKQYVNYIATQFGKKCKAFRFAEGALQETQGILRRQWNPLRDHSRPLTIPEWWSQTG
jgi:hypothetical protein